MVLTHRDEVIYPVKLNDEYLPELEFCDADNNILTEELVLELINTGLKCLNEIPEIIICSNCNNSFDKRLTLYPNIPDLCTKCVEKLVQG